MLLLTLAALTFADPGPMDAFRGNFSSIDVKLYYTFKRGYLGSNAVARGYIWDERDLGFEEKPDTSIIGQWSSDGRAERYQFSSPQEQIDRNPELFMPVPGGQGIGSEYIYTYTPPTEALFDGEVLAGHVIYGGGTDEATIKVWRNGDPNYLARGKGPFFWWGPRPFPDYVASVFPGINPSRSEAEIGGYHVEVETYRKPRGEGWTRMDICYDPSIGYLPRYARIIVALPGRKARIRELYLCDATLCASGGFVPMEWIETEFKGGGHELQSPDYNVGARIVPDGRVFAGHFLVTEIEDRPQQIRFEHIDGIKYVASAGGTVRIPPRSDLGLNEIRTVLGTRLDGPAAPILPTLDRDELAKYSERHRVGWGWYAAIASFLIAAGIWARRRYAASIAALCLVMIAGCGHVGEPVPRLSAAFTKTNVLVEDAGIDGIPMKLVIRNTGNCPLRIYDADGGCSCRQVDREAFPTELGVGKSVTVGVNLSGRDVYDSKRFMFEFATDRGPMHAPVEFFALRRYSLSPGQLSHGSLIEGDDWSFRLVRRAVFRADEGPPRTELIVPARFSARRVDRNAGIVSKAPQYGYEDITYDIELLGDEMGLSKEVISLSDGAGHSLAESHITWTRRPYLSATPDRVHLGARPVRVFLRCPDDSVEFVDVVSAPEGVEAVVSSRRELTVSLDSDAPSIIDGTIEVSTTYGDGATVRVVAKRYAANGKQRGSNASREGNPLHRGGIGEDAE